MYIYLYICIYISVYTNLLQHLKDGVHVLLELGLGHVARRADDVVVRAEAYGHGKYSVF